MTRSVLLSILALGSLPSRAAPLEAQLDCVDLRIGVNGAEPIHRPKGKHHVLDPDRLQSLTVRPRNEKRSACDDAGAEVTVTVRPAGQERTSVAHVQQVSYTLAASIPRTAGVRVLAALAAAGDPTAIALRDETEPRGQLLYDVEVRVTAADGSTLSRTTTYDTLVDFEERQVELSLVSQPVRFAALNVPCQSLVGRAASPEEPPGQADARCQEDPFRSVVIDSISTSPISLRYRWSPMPRYPWWGFGADLAAFSLASSGLLVNAASPEDEASIQTRLRAEVDSTFGFDFAFKNGDTQLNLLVGGGMALANFGGVIRPQPMFALGLSTPLLITGKKKWSGTGREESAFGPTATLRRAEAALDAVARELEDGGPEACGADQEPDCIDGLDQIQGALAHREEVEAQLASAEKALETLELQARTAEQDSLRLERAARLASLTQAAKEHWSALEARMASFCASLDTADRPEGCPTEPEEPDQDPDPPEETEVPEEDSAPEGVDRDGGEP